VGSDPQEGPSFSVCLENQTQVAHFEVAETAVNESGRPAAGSCAEVALVEESGSDTAHCGIPGDASAVDPGAYD
jgi:hypothetical protein